MDTFVGFGRLEFVGFQPGELFDDLSYCPAILGLRDTQVEVVGLADDLRRGKAAAAS